MINLWEIWNKDVHGNTDKEIEEIKKRRVTAEIIQYFELRQKCCVLGPPRDVQSVRCVVHMLRQSNERRERQGKTRIIPVFAGADWAFHVSL